MPFAVKHKGSKYQVFNTQTDRAMAKPTTKAKADRQATILKQIEHHWSDNGDGTYSREINGKQVTLNLTQGGNSGS